MEKGEPNVDLANEVLLLIIFFFFFFSFHFPHFSIFFFKCKKDGTTPLYIAAENEHEQTVQILLEKGEPNVDLANKVILLIVSFSFHFLIFLFLFFFECKEWSNSSLYCC